MPDTVTLVTFVYTFISYIFSMVQQKIRSTECGIHDDNTTLVYIDVGSMVQPLLPEMVECGLE